MVAVAAFGSKKKYATWDEAFQGLIPEVQQQSFRVAEYTQVIFLQACASGYGGSGNAAKKRMRGQNGDVAYCCGQYHQIGKAMVPPEYQLPRKDFTPEEKALYRRYPAAGRSLTASLERDFAHIYMRGRGTAPPRDARRTAYLMVQEACQQHQERWDGSGYPEGLARNGISLMGQIVGIAKELDRLSAETRDEKPFDYAVRTITANSGKDWSPELVEVLQKALPKCREVYEKYKFSTQAIPETIPLVERREGRPMGLQYRPMVSDLEGTVAAYEAIPWFGGTVGEVGETQTVAQVEELLKRTELLSEVSYYLLYEASDTGLRLQNCRLEASTVLVQIPQSFFRLPTQLQGLTQLFECQGIPKEKLLIALGEDTYLSLNKGQTEVVCRYLRNGLCILLDGYHPGNIPAEQLREQGFTHLRMDPELYGKQASANELTRLKRMGFTLVGGEADSQEGLAWQLENGIAFTGGTFTGPVTGEDDMIRTALAKERNRKE